MMKRINKRLLATAVAAALALPTAAFATNGYFSHGYGTKNKGLAGGGSALPQDSMAAATNPAGMVWVGDRMDLGAAIFSPHRSYSQDIDTSGFPIPVPGQAGTVDSDSEYFLIPHFGRNWMLDANSSVGVTVYGNGGMNTDYPASVNGGAGTFFGGAFGGEAGAGVNLEQLFVNATYSRKINDKSSWGASAILAYQRFEATGLRAFDVALSASSDPAHLTDNGTDTSMGYGFKLGWQGEVSPGLTLAASYQSEMEMDEFSDYAGLFAEQGGFNIPATWTLGLAYDIQSAGTVTFDVQKIMYSDVKSIANPISKLLVDGQPLGGNDGPGFGWEDMTVYKLGYQWSTSPDWTWRVGYSTGDQPIPQSEVLFNILAPGVMEQHFTGGFTKKTGPDSEFNFAAMYAPSNDVTGPNPVNGGASNIKLEMDQWELEASWGWKF
jgi:long-chain fatty acid transport protein